MYKGAIWGKQIGNPGQEQLHEFWDVFDALTQWRQPKRDDVDTIVEVLAELAFLDCPFKIDVCRHDQPEFGLDGLGAADPLNLAFLDGAEQLGLEIKPKIRDLVQKERAVGCELELADLRLVAMASIKPAPFLPWLPVVRTSSVASGAHGA